MVFEQNSVPRPNLEKVRFECSFTIINRQPLPAVGFVELTDRRVWVTNVYEEVYFNDFIKFGIVNDRKKGLIFNGMTGSRWRFKRFDRLCICVNSDEIRQIRIDILMVKFI